jgi:hypothetical protein
VSLSFGVTLQVLSWVEVQIPPRLRSCDTTTFGSPTIPCSSKGLSACDLSLATPNVNDGVCCLSSGNYVLGESKASPNIDINVFSKTLILQIKHIYIYIFFISFHNLQHFFIKNLKVLTRFNEHGLIQEHSYKLLFTFFHMN